MPTIQLVGMLVNNTLYKYDVNLEFDYIGDFLLGNSIANITILYVCSYTFGFCKWHRHIIMANLVNVIIATIDKVFIIPITDMELLCSYYVIAGIFIIIAARSHVKDIQHVRNINREITYWDVYVAVNAQYHDYVRLYQDWFPNLTEEQLDEKVIYSAINFWFKDEDAGTGKVWNYFKEI